jgi:CPA2 family monovalent cation:H+ antiporter-2
LELSIQKLVRMRQLVLGAGSLQLAATLLLVFAVLWFFDFAPRHSLFWGFLIATNSTAIVLKLLFDRGELDSVHGRAVLGLQLFGDLSVVPMMAVLAALAAPGTAQTLTILWALAKSLLVVGAILVGAYYLFPPLLRALVLARSRELFIIGTVFFALGTAFGASQFGLSLALGAFLAGVVLSESEYGHQVMAEILPFRDVFSSLFFISVGMLVNLRFVADHLGTLLLIAGAIIVLKLLTNSLAVSALGYPLRLSVLVALALAQVGEFSFVLLREGDRLGLVSNEHFQLFLAATVITMILTPPLIAAGPHVSQWLGRKGGRRSWLKPDEKTEQMQDHVIICGYGLNGRRLARLLRENQLPYLVVEMNSSVVRAARMEGENIYYGDVSNYEILKHAGAARARGIVFAISDPAILPRAISNARIANPDLHIIARIKRIEDARELRLAGATDVIAEELEAWMEIVTRILRLYGMPREVVARQITSLREEDYEMLRILPIPGQPLRHLAHLLPQVELDLFYVLPDSGLRGTNLRTINLRTRTGANVLAVVRESEVVHNPPGSLRFEEGDQLLLMGSREQLAAAFELLNQPRLTAQPPHDAWSPS